jgi:hypothetical protein
MPKAATLGHAGSALHSPLFDSFPGGKHAARWCVPAAKVIHMQEDVLDLVLPAKVRTHARGRRRDERPAWTGIKDRVVLRGRFTKFIVLKAAQMRLAAQTFSSESSGSQEGHPCIG